MKLTTHLSIPWGWKAELALFADLQLTVYPYKRLPIGCRSVADRWKFAGQRPTFYHWATQPTTIYQVWTVWDFVFELCSGQTNKQTDGLERSTHADRIGNNTERRAVSLYVLLVGVAGREQGRPTAAGWQQDGVCVTGLCPRTRTQLRGLPCRGARGEAVQSLYVQLGAKVYEHRRQTGQ